MMRWLGYAVISHVMYCVTWVLAPALAKLAQDRLGAIDNNNGFAIEPRLPYQLECLGTDDNSLLGDAGHKERWAGKSRDEQMVAWLRRNPNYVFERELLGAHVVAGDAVRTFGKVSIRNRDQGATGCYWCRVGTWWNFKAIVKLPFLDRCVMWEYGWKLQDIAKASRVVGDFRYQIAVPLLLFVPRFTTFYRA